MSDDIYVRRCHNLNAWRAAATTTAAELAPAVTPADRPKRYLVLSWYDGEDGEAGSASAAMYGDAKEVGEAISAHLLQGRDPAFPDTPAAAVVDLDVGRELDYGVEIPCAEADHDNLRCPACRCEETDEGQFHCEGRDLYQRRTCLGCGATWKDHYRLAGYTGLEPS